MLGIIARYQEHLPLPQDAKVVTLGEGATPLLQLVHLPAKLGIDCDVYVKCEGANPTGSFKDRGMTMAVTHAVAEGYSAVICASTGNTSASAAAYAARAGLRCFVVVPEGRIARGKLAQAMMHNAVIMQISGNFDDGMRLVKEITEESSVCLVNSVNPYRLQGQKTAAFEIVDELHMQPDYHCLPVGNAGNISAYWMGYSEYHSSNKAPGKPRMCGYQAAGAAPFISGGPVAKPETVATAIRIGNPQSWDLAQRAVAESGGWFEACTDEEILKAQLDLASEGIFCEPASAASFAGLCKDAKRGRIEKGGTVVCTLTGHGLKDPDTAVEQSSKYVRIEKVPTEVQAIRDLIASCS